MVELRESKFEERGYDESFIDAIAYARHHDLIFRDTFAAYDALHFLQDYV